MDGLAPIDWPQGNREILAVAFRRLCLELQGEDSDALKAGTQMSVIEDRMPAPSELARLTRAFGLSAVEQSVLLLGALADQAPALSGVLQAHPHAVEGYATPAVVEDVLGAAEALGPEGRLRQSGLVTLSTDARQYERRIIVPEAVRETLAGRRCLDPMVSAVLRDLPLLAQVGDGYVAQLTQVWQRACRDGGTRVLFAALGDLAHVTQAFGAAMLAGGQMPRVLDGAAIPLDAQERADFVRTLRRDLVLTETALAIEAGDCGPVAWGVAADLGLPVLVLGASPPETALVSALRLPAPEVSGSAWSALFDPEVCESAEVRAVSDVLHLNVAQVRRAVESTAAGLAPDLATAARDEIGDRMGHLAQRVHPLCKWEDLILPDAQQDALSTMAGFLVHRGQVTQDWGFAEKSGRGLGMAAIFHGASGTGKTTAAEALVARMEAQTGTPVPLYRVNVAALVSKYIGETAKNFETVFEAGKAMGAALLFDEAEGLFGQRMGSVKDSIDKHANAELGFLLQCLEGYPGIAILTTNMRAAIDDAFFRRFRFAIEFPFPDRVQRRRIWEGVLPDALPKGDLDFDALAGPSLSGGNIRSVAINAAYLAAAAEVPVSMAHLARAVRQEFGKLERSAPEKELRGWGA